MYVCIALIWKTVATRREGDDTGETWSSASNQSKSTGRVCTTFILVFFSLERIGHGWEGLKPWLMPWEILCQAGFLGTGSDCYMTFVCWQQSLKTKYLTYKKILRHLLGLVGKHLRKSGTQLPRRRKRWEKPLLLQGIFFPLFLHECTLAIHVLDTRPPSGGL